MMRQGMAFVIASLFFSVTVFAGECHLHSQLGTLIATGLSPKAACIQRTDNYLAAQVVNGQGQFANASGVEGIEVYQTLNGQKSCSGFIEYIRCVDDDKTEPPPVDVVCHYYPELDKITLTGLDQSIGCAHILSGQATSVTNTQIELKTDMKVGLYQSQEDSHCNGLITTINCTKEGKPPLKKLFISGWYNDGWNATSHAVYSNNVDLFSEINPYWYNLGTSDGPPGNQAIDGSLHERAYVYSPAMVKQAHDHGTKVLPSVGDAYIAGVPQVNRICTNSKAREKLFQHLVEIAKHNHYDGWDLNFEAVSFNQDYVKCMNALAQTLHQHQLELSLTIKPTVPDLIKQMHAIDRFKTMQYDDFDSGVDVVAPNNPLSWIEKNIQALLAQGVPANKLQLAIANYGWEWRITGGKAKRAFPFRPYEYFKERVSNQQWDNEAQEWFSYYVYEGRTYHAYFADAKTVMPRVDLALKYNLLGVTFWVLGKEDPAIYQKLRERLTMSG